MCGILRADDTELQRLGDSDAEYQQSAGWNLSTQLHESHSATAVATAATATAATSVPLPPVTSGGTHIAPCIPPSGAQRCSIDPDLSDSQPYAAFAASSSADTIATSSSSGALSAVSASAVACPPAAADPSGSQAAQPEQHSAPVSGVSWLAQRELLFKARGSFTPCSSRGPATDELLHLHPHHHHDPPTAAGASGRPKCEDQDAGSGSDSEISGSGQSSGSSADSRTFRINSTTLTNLLEEALKDAFRKTDEEFACDGSASMVGSTAVVALVGSKKLFVANCGGCRVLSQTAVGAGCVEVRPVR